MIAPLMSLLLLLVGCFGELPTLASVQPGAAQPGDTLTVRGTGFGPETTLRLVRGTDEVVLPLTAEAEGSVQADLPADLPPGIWQVVLDNAAGQAKVSLPLDVWTADVEPPCTKRYALNTETSRTQRKIAFERIYTDRPTTRHVFLGEQLASLELTTSTVEAGTCWGLWLHDADGKRWLIADDTRDLSREAQQIATVLELPLTTP